MSNEIISFVVNAGLYDEVTITEQNIQQLISVVNGEERIDVFCPHCKEKRVFSVFPVIVPSYKDENSNSAYKLGSMLMAEQKQIHISRTPGPLTKPYMPREWTWKELAGEGARVFVLKCICAMNKDHHLDYVLLSKNDQLIKVGQYPSVADLSFPELRMYKNVFSDVDMRELKRAIGLHAQGIGVGAFVYLRRILERMVMKVMEEGIASGTVSQEIRKADFGEKTKALKASLPDVLCNNPIIYGILSKGIHELSEEDCLRCFPVVKQCIILMLEDWEKERQKKKNEAELSRALSRLNSSL